MLHDDGRYYRDQKQAPPKLEAEEVAEPVEERKPLDPEQLLREAEEQAGSLDEVHTALRQMLSVHETANQQQLTLHCFAVSPLCFSHA